MQKIKEYWAKNTTDLITICSFISRALRWLIFLPLSFFIFELITGMYLIESVKQIPKWIDNVLTVLVMISNYIMVYSAQIFLWLFRSFG